MCRKKYKVKFICTNHNFIIYKDQTLDGFFKLKDAVSYAQEKLNYAKQYNCEPIKARIVRVLEEEIKELA